MKDNLVGVLFVAVQAGLLGVLLVLPERPDWPTPGWLRLVGLALVFAGAVLIGLSARSLGSALTPTPVPSVHGELTTSGLYAHMRHPIYSGVLVVVVGLTLRSGSFAALALALAIFVFFNEKARWEESRLCAKYPAYAEYAVKTPRFFKSPWRR